MSLFTPTGGARAALRSPIVVLIGLSLTALLAGCGDDLYDSGGCQVSQLPSGQSKVECENGDTLIIGDVVADGTCTLRPEPDGSSTLRCEGEDYVIPGPASSESYSCLLGTHEGAETVRCRELVQQAPSCSSGLSGFMFLGDDPNNSGPAEDFMMKDTFLRYGCSHFTGSIRVAGDLRESDLEVLNRLTTMNGHIEVDFVNAEALEFSGLRGGAVGLEVRYSESLRELRLPRLTALKYLTFYENTSLEVVDAPQLVSISETFQLWNSPALRTLSFPELVEAALELAFFGESLETFNFSKLASGRLSIREATLNIDLQFPEFQTGLGIILTRNTTTGTFAFPKLFDGGNIRIDDNEGLAALSFPALASARSIAITANAELLELNLPALVSAQAIEIQNSNELLEIDLPALRTMSNPEDDTELIVANNRSIQAVKAPQLRALELVGVRIESNPSLETVVFDELSTLAAFTVNSNPALEMLVLPKLQEVTDQLQVSNNDSLTRLDIALLSEVPRLLVENNTSLQELVVTELQNVSEVLLIRNNYGLDQCAVNLVLAQLLSPPASYNLTGNHTDLGCLPNPAPPNP